MRKLIALVVLCACLMGVSIVVDPNKPLSSFYANMTCNQATELYDEAGMLFQLSGNRLDNVKEGPSKFFWSYMRTLTMSLHDPLLVRKNQVCKEA